MTCWKAHIYLWRCMWPIIKSYDYLSLYWLFMISYGQLWNLLPETCCFRLTKPSKKLVFFCDCYVSCNFFMMVLKQITSSDFQDWNFGTIPPPLPNIGGLKQLPQKFSSLNFTPPPPPKKWCFISQQKKFPYPPKNVIQHATPIRNKLKKVFLPSSASTSTST